MKRVISVILALFSLASVCSCSNKKLNITDEYALPSEIRTVSSGAVAENKNFVLTYDSSLDNLILYNKKTDGFVSTIPYGHYSSQEETTPYVNNKLNSAIVVSCVNNKDSSVTDYFSYDSVVSENTCYSVKIKNGVRVVYFFSEPEISVPVDYTLTDGGLRAEVLISEITEGVSDRIYKISLLPYFASAKNDTDSYLFVPSGSGALMYTDSGKRDIRFYSEPVYGEDATYDTVYKLNKSEQVCLPCFGAKNGNDGVFSVISKGSELGYIEASAGDEQIGYSSAFASFYLRGEDIAKIKNSSGANQVVKKIAEDMATQESASVDYYILNGESDYNAMARLYRSILTSQGRLSDTKDERQLVLDILGGALIDKSFLGISYKEVAAATSLSQADEIIFNINESLNGCDSAVILKGFTCGGLDATEVGGGFKLASKLGTAKELKALSRKCDNTDISLAFDFDLIRFSKSGFGYSVSKDSARNLNNVSAKFNEFTLVTNEIDTSASNVYLLKRGLIYSAAEKALKCLDNYGISGISLSTLSNICYSDYSDSEYYVKAGACDDFDKLSKMIKSGNKFTVSYSANEYAAVNSEIICDTPTGSSKYFALDEDIPFYQMIFKGCKSLSSHSLNTQADFKNEYLKAVQSGIALKFSLIYEFNSDFISTSHSALSGSVYSDIRPMLLEAASEALPFLKSVSGAKIEKYSESDGVSLTVFDNGVEIYVNFNDKAVDTPLGTVSPYDFIYSRKGE